MKNLNKFSKAELIKQYKKLEDQNSNQTLFFKIINYIIYFKSLIIKITFIGFLIKWIRKYSLVRKLWHIFSLIGNALLGFTLIDIYSWDIISWIKDTSICRWYSELFNYSKTDKIETIENPSKFPKGMIERTSIETNGNEKEIEINNRINRWFNKEEIDNQEILIQQEFNSIEESNKSNWYNKYYIIAGLLFISCLTWYYYGDDIKPFIDSTIEKIRNLRRPDNDPDNNPTNINNPILRSWRSSVEDIKNKDISTLKSSLRDKFYKTIEVDNVENVQATSSNVKIEDLNKAKSVLTSPSLENLNEQAESSWSERISSPDSDKTVTPASISESSASSSSSSSSLINASNLIKDNWRNNLSVEVNNKINFIESSLNNNEIDNNITDYFAYLVNEYNTEIGVYNFMKNNLSRYSIENVDAVKESIYYFREWISEYQTKIFSTSNVTIEIGSINDSPKILNKNIV